MLSYICQRIIIEHFEANKRLHFSCRCPAISKVEKSIPLKLNQLSFFGSDISINTIDHKLKEVYIPGFLFDHIKYTITVNSRDIISKILPEGIDLNEAYRKLADRYLNGRVKMRVENFLCNDYKTHFPAIETLKIQAKNVNFWGFFQEHVWNLIDVSSHPLCKLTISIVDTKTFDLPGIRDAQNLILQEFNASRLLPNLLILRNEIIKLDSPSITSVEVIQLVRDWKNNKRAIGSTCLLRNCPHLNLWNFNRHVVVEVMETMGGTSVDKRELGEHLPRGLTALAIPVPSSPESELLLIGYKTDDYSYDLAIQLVSVPRGSYRISFPITQIKRLIPI